MDSEHGSGSTKHSRTQPEVVDGNNSSKHSRTNQEEFVDGSGRSRHSATHPEATVDEGGQPAPAKKLVSCCSSSSSSSNSSLEDFFQVKKNEVTESSAGITASPNPDEDSQPVKKGNEIDVSSLNSSCKSEEPDNVANGPTSSQVSDITHESVMQIMSSPTLSPPAQVMERSGEYSPYRIPSSVFARSKSTTPMEWSVASNESLFSIQVGNTSFSRDHIIMLGKSGELTKSGELIMLNKSGELTKSGELIMFSPPPPVTIVEIDRKSVDKEKNSAEVADESIKDSSRATTDDLSEEKVIPPVVSWNSSDISRHSDESGTSTQSFAFPIKKKCAWPFCYCSNCSRAFSYCTWPSCYCSNCSRAFRYCWNRSRKRLCCFSSSTILTEGGRSGSEKLDTEHQCLQTQTSKVTSNLTTNSWFPCFSWCPRRCC